MCPNTKFVYFSTHWEVRFAEYDTVQRCYVIRKELRNEFVTAYNNIPLHWYAQIRRNKDDESKLDFYVYYTDGAPEKLDGVELEIGVIKAGDKRTTGNEASTRGHSRRNAHFVDPFCGYPSGASSQKQTAIFKEAKRGFGYGWSSFEENNFTAVRNKYGPTRHTVGILTNADRMVYQLTVKIPVDTFSYVLPTPTSTPFAPWAAQLFNTINVPNNSSFPDAKLISRDDVVYHCHKNVIAIQSEPLATMLRDPLATQADGDQQHPPASKSDYVPPSLRGRTPPDVSGPGGGAWRRGPSPDVSGQWRRGPPMGSAASVNDQSKKKRKKGEYDFPTMSASSLKSMIEYLYTGNTTTMGNLTVAELLEVADAGEQYALKPLKELCGVEMWKRVVNDPQSACQIVSFAHLHEMKSLKYRGLDVIASLPKLERRTVVDQFGEDLRNDFDDYLADRLLPYVNLAGRHPY